MYSQKDGEKQETTRNMSKQKILFVHINTKGGAERSSYIFRIKKYDFYRLICKVKSIQNRS